MATYGKTTMTTYKGTSDEVLVLCGDSEINEYFLNNIITTTGAYIFCVWYKSEEDAEITFNVFGEEETVESTEVWQKYVKRIDVETLTNDDISITVTPEINTYFYEAFCVNGRADTSWYPSDLDYDDGIVRASQTATNYITYLNAQDGIKVHREGDDDAYVQINPTVGVKNVYNQYNYSTLNSQGLEIFQGTTRANSIAKFADVTRIGEEDGDNIEISSAGVSINKYPYAPFEFRREAVGDGTDFILSYEDDELDSELRFSRDSVGTTLSAKAYDDDTHAMFTSSIELVPENPGYIYLRGQLYSVNSNSSGTVKQLFATRKWSWTDYVINANAMSESTNTITLTGYTPIALLGYDLDGEGCTYINVVACMINPSNSTVSWQFRNLNTSQATITKNVRVLYIASSAGVNNIS